MTDATSPIITNAVITELTFNKSRDEHNRGFLRVTIESDVTVETMREVEQLLLGRAVVSLARCGAANGPPCAASHEINHESFLGPSRYRVTAHVEGTEDD